MDGASDQTNNHTEQAQQAVTSTNQSTAGFQHFLHTSPQTPAITRQVLAMHDLGIVSVVPGLFLGGGLS